eukprot:COSAG01_NODE_69738_length_260_cov_1.229814_1_plen_36_part_01
MQVEGALGFEREKMYLPGRTRRFSASSMSRGRMTVR